MLKIKMENITTNSEYLKKYTQAVTGAKHKRKVLEILVLNGMPYCIGSDGFPRLLLQEADIRREIIGTCPKIRLEGINDI